jgi:hypothetical protein
MTKQNKKLAGWLAGRAAMDTDADTPNATMRECPKLRIADVLLPFPAGEIHAKIVGTGDVYILFCSGLCYVIRRGVPDVLTVRVPVRANQSQPAHFLSGLDVRNISGGGKWPPTRSRLGDAGGERIGYACIY